MTTPSRRISNELEERKRERERKNIPFIVATYVCACSPRAAHALRLHQLPKIVAYLGCSAGRMHFARTKMYERLMAR